MIWCSFVRHHVYNYLTLAYTSISTTTVLWQKTGGAWNEPPISIYWFQKGANSTRRFSIQHHLKNNSLSSAVVHNAYRFTGKRPIHMYVRVPRLYISLVEGEIDSAHYYDRLMWKCCCVDCEGCFGLTGNWSKGASGHMIWTFNTHSIRNTRNNQMQRPVNIHGLRVQTLHMLVILLRFLSPWWLFLAHEKLYRKSIVCRSPLREIPICTPDTAAVRFFIPVS